MPSYRYRCAFDGDMDVELRPIDVGQAIYCPKCGMLMVRVYVMPNVSATFHDGEVADKVKYEKTLGKDRDAYKRMRNSGVQPAGIKNAAFIEKHADTLHEVEMGKICQDKASLRKGVDLAQEVVGKDLTL